MGRKKSKLTEEESLNINRIFGKNLRDRRVELGMTQQELAEKLGFQFGQAISHLELGKNDISISWLPTIAKILRCNVAYLLGIKEAAWTEDVVEVFPGANRPTSKDPKPGRGGMQRQMTISEMQELLLDLQEKISQQQDNG